MLNLDEPSPSVFWLLTSDSSWLLGEDGVESRRVPEPPPAPGRRTRWGAGRRAEDVQDPWWKGEDPWFKDRRGDPEPDPGETPEDPWKSYDNSVEHGDIEHFAEHLELDLRTVYDILAGLKTEEVEMVLRRFQAPKGWRGDVEMLLQRYVDSCRRNGFWKIHGNESLADFASSWAMSLDAVKAELEPCSFEEKNQVISGFRFDDSDYSDVLNSFRSYVGSLPPKKGSNFFPHSEKSRGVLSFEVIPRIVGFYLSMPEGIFQLDLNTTEPSL